MSERVFSKQPLRSPEAFEAALALVGEQAFIRGERSATLRNIRSESVERLHPRPAEREAGTRAVATGRQQRDQGARASRRN